MQKTIHIFLFLFISILASAQSFSVSSTYASSQGKNGEEVSPAISLKNTTNSNIELRWEKVRNNAPQGWEVVVCDKQCYTGLVDSKKFTLAPGESLNDFRVSFRPNGVDGIGNVEIKIYDVRNPASSTTVVFAASAQNSSMASTQSSANAPNI